jgi:methyl-accepting chemotaxis protein
MELVRGIDGESSRVIDTMRESGANINESRESINDIGENLSSIIALANETVAKVNEIHRTAQGQARRGDEVVGLMREIAKVTSDNNEATLSVSQSAVEQTNLTAGMSRQSEELTRLAENLRTVIDRFKLGRERV